MPSFPQKDIMKLSGCKHRDSFHCVPFGMTARREIKERADTAATVVSVLRMLAAAVSAPSPHSKHSPVIPNEVRNLSCFSHSFKFAKTRFDNQAVAIKNS